MSISSLGRREYTSGEIINLVAVDCSKVWIIIVKIKDPYNNNYLFNDLVT